MGRVAEEFDTSIRTLLSNKMHRLKTEKLTYTLKRVSAQTLETLIANAESMGKVETLGRQIRQYFSNGESRPNIVN
jgi:hypothetical protein